MNAWPTVALRDCCEIYSGATPRTSVAEFWDGEICWATPKDLSSLEGPFISDTARKVTQAGIDGCGASVLPVGAVLLTTRAPIGYVAMNAVPMATNQGFKSFVPAPERLLAGYLFHWLRANREYLQRIGNGATFKELSQAAVARIEVPLPDLEEQQLIVDVLDRASLVLRGRRQARAMIDDLAHAIFLDMIGDPISNPKGWNLTALGDVVATTSGGTPNRAVNDYFGGEVPWVKSGELHQDVITATEESLTQQGLAASSAKVMPAGTVLVAMYGATAGAVSILGIEAATNQAICCMSPSEKIDSKFLSQLVKQLAPSLLGQRVGGAQPNLSQNLIRKLKIPLPPKPVQLDFVQRAGAVERLGATCASSLAATEALFASLQERAFRGELLPEDARIVRLKARPPQVASADGHAR